MQSKIIKFSLLALSLNPSVSLANAVFGKTHMQASPLTMPAGTLVLGTSFAYGVTDFFQISTNVLRDFYQFYNAQAKLSLFSVQEFALALTGGFEHYNLRRVSNLNPDVTITSWIPGVTAAFELQPRVALIAGAEVAITSIKVNNSTTQSSGYQRGSQVGADLAWAYHPPTEKYEISNALSAGVTYDITYDLYGFGLSHHWPGFQVGFHYYPDADRNRVVPILAGGLAVEI